MMCPRCADRLDTPWQLDTAEETFAVMFAVVTGILWLNLAVHVIRKALGQ